MHGHRSRLSRLEWEIMSVIWELDGAPSVRDVLERAYPNGEKAYTTIQTVMNNLERKGFLRKKKIGLVNFYQPAGKRQEAVKDETNDFVEKVFGGSFLAMANHLVRSGALTREEVNDLKHLIHKKEHELQGKNQ